MADVPNTRFIDFVATTAKIHYSQYGTAEVPLDPTTGNVIDLGGFRKISLQIGTTKAQSSSVFIGKIGNVTLSQEFRQPADTQIHTFDVVGPEMKLFLNGGKANSDERVQLWVYLRS